MELKFNFRKIARLDTRLAACLFAGFIPLSAAPSLAATVTYSQLFTTGWNLAGNSLTTEIDVKATFGTQAGIQSVWKWDAAGSKWAFYSPALDTAGTLTNYASTKGYNVLTQISKGEGYWVNTSAQISLAQASGTGFSLAASNLVTGWNLVATGDDITPVAFTNTVGNVTTQWAWDNATSAWYFYAPALAANSTLASYITSKSYKDFGTVTLGNGRGFWVNYAGSGGGTGGTTPVAGLMGGAIQGTPLNLTTAVTTLAGSAGSAGTLDGVGSMAQFWNPFGIATDGTNLYVADTYSLGIRKIVIATGVVTTLAGSGALGSINGVGTAATFSMPRCITTDGINLYVTDGSRIRKIVIATGAVTTLAGSGTQGGTDGTGAAASFYQPHGITTDGTNLYVADLVYKNIRKIVIATGVVSTLAGNILISGSVDGTGTAAAFNQPRGITTDGTNLYVTDSYSSKIRKIVIATGAVTTLAGSGTVGGVDGTGTAASFNQPYGITTDGTNLYVADTSNCKIRKIVIATGIVTTLVGGASYGSVNGTGNAARFKETFDITTDGTNLYVLENDTIRMIQ